MWAITCKDLRLIVRDRRVLAILLGLPVVLIAILGVSTGRIETGQSSKGKLQLVVLDQGATDAGLELADSLRDHPLVIVDEREGAGTRRGIDWRGRVVLGPEFVNRIGMLTLEDLLRPRRGWPGQGLARLDARVEGQANDDPVGKIIVEELVLAEIRHLALDRLARRDTDLLRLLTSVRTRILWQQPISMRSIYEEGLEGAGVYQVLVPSYAVLFIFFLVNFISSSMIAERSLGTLCRLRVSSLHPLAIIAGKTVPFFLVSVAQSVLLLVGGWGLFGMWWGAAPWMLAPVVATTSLAATTLGLAAATFAHTETQVAAYDTLLVIGLGAISGCLMPREWLPDMVRQVSLVTPHAWALIAYDQLLTEMHPSIMLVWQCCLVLVVFSAAFAMIGWWRFDRWSQMA